ncbi:uncharacterized protein LOC132696956 [Cylas formicarius]|uniref:uncharacterized protein LOC132696956 n=1 Tax=Cylas formicarius TaxID=197179 RepID=UPI0029583888|nr:uncharacterized protein LOC132696956 [Cylas formicarius]
MQTKDVYVRVTCLLIGVTLSIYESNMTFPNKFQEFCASAICVFCYVKTLRLFTGLLTKTEDWTKQIFDVICMVVQFISLVILNICFGVVILFLILNHFLQQFNVCPPKYVAMAAF